MHYFSLSQKTLIDTDKMSPQHIERAISKIAAHRHPMYAANGNKVTELRTELIERYKQQVRELKTQIAAREEVGRVTKAQPDTTGTRHVPGHMLSDLRDLALSLCQKLGTVTADTLRKEVSKRGQHVPGHALAYVFSDPRFKKVGFLRSTTPSNKGRFICVWASSKAV